MRLAGTVMLKIGSQVEESWWTSFRVGVPRSKRPGSVSSRMASLPSRNTDGLIGGVVKVLEGEGIHLRDSTWLLKPLLAGAGVLTRRKPSKEEMADVEYGCRVANALAGFDVGQAVAIFRS